MRCSCVQRGGLWGGVQELCVPVVAMWTSVQKLAQWGEPLKTVAFLAFVMFVIYRWGGGGRHAAYNSVEGRRLFRVEMFAS